MKSLARIKKDNGVIRKFHNGWKLVKGNDADRTVFLMGRGCEAMVGYCGGGVYQVEHKPYHTPLEVKEWLDKNVENLFCTLNA